MSDENSNAVNLPDAVETGAGSRGWRIADGYFMRGRKEDGSLEKRERFLGYVRRVGIHEGELDDGRKYAKLEIDLECRSGIESIGATLLSATAGKPSYTQCIALAQTICAAADGQLIQLETALASQKNRYGKFQTFLNSYTVDPVTLRPSRMKFDRPAGDLDDVLQGLLAGVRSHPSYKDRPKRQQDELSDDLPDEKKQTGAGGSLIAEFENAVYEKGWPSIDAAKEGYLQMASLTAKGSGLPNGYQSYSDIQPEVMKAMIKATKEAAKLPKILEPFVNAAPDPFA